MIIGVPKEVKNNENRVSVTPEGVRALTIKNHKVIIQENAGIGCGISNEAYVKHGVVHYSVANMPGTVAKTATLALTSVTRSYLEKLVSNQLVSVLKEDAALRSGLNCYKGRVTNENVAKSLEMDYVSSLDLL